MRSLTPRSGVIDAGEEEGRLRLRPPSLLTVSILQKQPNDGCFFFLCVKQEKRSGRLALKVEGRHDAFPGRRHRRFPSFLRPASLIDDLAGADPDAHPHPHPTPRGNQRPCAGVSSGPCFSSPPPPPSPRPPPPSRLLRWANLIRARDGKAGRVNEILIGRSVALPSPCPAC